MRGDQLKYNLFKGKQDQKRAYNFSWHSLCNFRILTRLLCVNDTGCICTAVDSANDNVPTFPWFSQDRAEE